MKRTLISLTLAAAATTSMTSLCMDYRMEDTDTPIPHSVQILECWRKKVDAEKQFQMARAELDGKEKAVKEGSLPLEQILENREMVYRLMWNSSYARQAFEGACKGGVSCETLTSILESMDATHTK